MSKHKSNGLGMFSVQERRQLERVGMVQEFKGTWSCTLEQSVERLVGFIFTERLGQQFPGVAGSSDSQVISGDRALVKLFDDLIRGVFGYCTNRQNLDDHLFHVCLVEVA